MSMTARWNVVDGLITVPMNDLALIGLVFLLLVILAFIIASKRFKRHAAKYDRTHQSLSEIEQQHATQSSAFEAWQVETERERSAAESTLRQLKDEAKELRERAAEKRPVYEELTRRLAAMEAEGERLQERHRDIISALDNRDGFTEQLNTLTNEIRVTRDEREQIQKQLNDLRLMLDLYGRQRDLIGYGHYEQPEYLYQSSERFKVEIARERSTQKRLISEQMAITGLDAITDKSKRSAWSRQGKLLLRAFNLECDKLCASIRHSNYVRTIERVGKLAHTLEKLMGDQRIGLSIEYVESKLTECTLVYQQKLKAKEEAEEERLQREQLKEERKAQREYEAALKKAQDEEKAYQDMLEKAREELSSATDDQALEQQERIRYLEQMLEQARENEQRAMSMAQQTRCGFVYVISNEGSFGKGVYKIGLTRRLDPMDRVKELGDASVPFSFDVHGIIYSEDAPRLESDLHQKFDGRRVNVVNSRKEFFRVELNQIESAINERIEDPIILKREGFEDDDYLEAMSLRNALIEQEGSLAAVL